MAEGALQLGACQLGVFGVCQMEDWVHVIGHAPAAETEEPVIHQVRCRR